MSSPKADRKLAELEALRSDPSSVATLTALRAALRDRSASVAAKAAKLAAEFGRRELLPELTQAFDRFLTDAARTDPQCWAKNAIAAALRTLRADDPGPWLRGVAHVQFEAVWGGKADTAAALRSACALALLDCDAVGAAQLLPILADLLADPEKTVRVDAVRAWRRPAAAKPRCCCATRPAAATANRRWRARSSPRCSASCPRRRSRW